MTRKNILQALIVLITTVANVGIIAAKDNTASLTSPDGRIKVSVTIGDVISYDVTEQGQTVVKNAIVSLTVGEKTLGARPTMTGKTTRSVNETISPVVPFKFSTIQNVCNELTMKFKGDYSLVMRAYDDGVAYRFVTNMKGQVEVMDEQLQMDLPEGYVMHVQQNPRFKTSYEEPYQHLKADEWNATADKYTMMPLVVETPTHKILISESALTDYPAMFFTSKNADKLTSVFPKTPLEFEPSGDRNVKFTKEADYIALTSGQRAFPWRYFVITTRDEQLVENTMTARLAEGNNIDDTSWIVPGVTTWEWWNGATPYGPDVDFVAGRNTETYKYYIDFASKFGVEYVLLDEGWARKTQDPFTPNDNLDLKELIQYANERNVGVILWLTWLCVENNPTLFERYEEWGVKGVKIDFMDRSDQWMVNFYERVAAEAARHHLFVDFHGSFKPAGLEYKYPNVLSYEGVLGMEQMSDCTPDNSLYLPFVRNAVGPMDYTPGAMLSYQPELLISKHPNPGSTGTRAYQMALYIVFETGLQMMADNPSLYYQNADCAHFMADVPVTTDETRCLTAKMGEYVIVAKRKGDIWYVGGITNNKEKERTFQLPLDFLDDGKTYTMTSYEDGVNANRQAMHYVKKETTLSNTDTITVRMVRNGGFAARLQASGSR